MTEPFPVVEVPADAPLSLEQMGSKEKFWFWHPGLGKCLFKAVREGTGEDWAEKVAAERCALVGLPHARYELATWAGKRGVVTPRFVPEKGSLVHGNELSGLLVEGYPEPAPGSRALYRVPQHTVERVLRILSAPRLRPPFGWERPSGVVSAVDVFLGYLALDAWIGNTDRHHENWGLLVVKEEEDPPRFGLHLAPTFDHASSLGRNESDERRKARLTTRDERFSVAGYASKASSALFLRETDRKPLSTLDAFREAAREHPAACSYWAHGIRTASLVEIRGILDRIPADRISQVGVEFALEMLRASRERIAKIGEGYR